MINRIRIISIILLKIFKSKIKIKTSLPKNIQIIYFENYTKQKLKHIINKNVKTFCLAGRFYETNTIYINFKIFLNYIKNLKYGISISYYISLIESLNPKLVMTIIDNSISFNILTKTLYKKIPFVSIQQSNRPEIYGNDYKFKNGYDTYNKNKSKFIDKFYTIADCDLFNHKKKKLSLIMVNP